jgi:hypothetical protein
MGLSRAKVPEKPLNTEATEEAQGRTEETLFGWRLAAGGWDENNYILCAPP